MDWGRGLEDCESCLKQDPKFIKAYIRKGKIQHFLKQYHKALSTYDQALEIEPSNAEVMEAKRATLIAIQSNDSDPERAKEAMKDPEIQQILRGQCAVQDPCLPWFRIGDSLLTVVSSSCCSRFALSRPDDLEGAPGHADESAGRSGGDARPRDQEEDREIDRGRCARRQVKRMPWRISRGVFIVSVDRSSL